MKAGESAVPAAPNAAPWANVFNKSVAVLGLGERARLGRQIGRLAQPIRTIAGENFELILCIYFPDSAAPSILNGTYSIPAITQVPEPTTLVLPALILGLGALRLARRRCVCFRVL